MGRNWTHGEREGRQRRSVVGSGKSPGMVAVAVHEHLERDHPRHSSHEGHPDNQGRGSRSAHSFQRCAGGRRSKMNSGCVG